MSKNDSKREALNDLVMDSTRLEAFIRDWVFEAWSDLASKPTCLLAEEITHVRTVAGLMAVLAPGRGLDPELAGIIGLLHDAGRLRPGGALENHAERGAAEVSVFLKENRLLPETSQEIAVNAIRRHSAKGKHQDDYDELLKDADVFQRFLEGEPILSRPAWRKRAAQVLEELRHYAVKAGDHTLILSPKDRKIEEGYLRFLSEVESWLMLRRHHVLDEKSVHDFRVFIRQIKALQSFFKPLFKDRRYELGQRQLRKALHTFEDARESAVELRALEAYAASLESSHDNRTRLDWVAFRSGVLTERVGAAVSEAGDLSWASILQAWERNMRHAALSKRVSEMPLDTFALKRVSRWLRQWKKHYGCMDFDNDTSIHESRIEVKKIRYVLRAIEKIIPLESRALLDALENYQSLSGALHDVAVSKTLHTEEGRLLFDSEADSEQGAKDLSGYLSFREMQGRAYRDLLRSAHARLTEEIEAWLNELLSFDFCLK
jgi:CHAD domain-containing protein